MVFTSETEYSPLSLDEYLTAFDPMGDMDLGLYRPEDGAALKYSVCNLYRYGTWVGFSYKKGHVTAEELKKDSFITNSFTRDLGLEEIQVVTTWKTYGEGSSARDISDKEMGLVCMGALWNSSSREMHTVIRRDELELSPVSPLTERGMSLFFTKVAELAEERGFEVRGIEDGELRLYAKGKLAVRIYEGGGGSYVSPLVSKDDSQKEIVFSTPCREQIEELRSRNISSPSKEVGDLIIAIQQMRMVIPEYLYPNDYPKIEQDEVSLSMK